MFFCVSSHFCFFFGKNAEYFGSMTLDDDLQIWRSFSSTALRFGAKQDDRNSQIAFRKASKDDLRVSLCWNLILENYFFPKHLWQSLKIFVPWIPQKAANFCWSNFLSLNKSELFNLRCSACWWSWVILKKVKQIFSDIHSCWIL